MKCYQNYELKKHTTFKIGGPAPAVYFPEHAEEFAQTASKLENPLILGACSNVLISSKGVKRDVIITTQMKQFSVAEDTVTAECGVKVPLLSRTAQKEGLSGFEFMIGFPGTVGGAVYMNASAHNQFISDTCIAALVFDLETKKVIKLSKEDLKFSYRHSVLSEKNYILLKAKFKLKRGDKNIITKLMEKHTDFRKDKQPNLTLPNAGSIFKNPPNDSAGRLIETTGLKGMTQGGAVIWFGHANFIINRNNADSKDVSLLMQKMYNRVKEKYNIRLEPEIKYIGTEDKEEEEIWNMMLNKK